MSSRSTPGDRTKSSAASEASARAANGASASAGAPEREGQRLGKYEIHKKLGSGGMGAVYLAFDPELKRNVAIKVLPRDKADNERLVKRFKAEAEAAAQLEHENIVAIYETGEADGYLYIALEYIEGTDVHNLIAKRGPVPVRRSIEIMKQVARALEHAHEKGIVHRDIKPSNLLIRRDGTVKLADLGLARSVDETTHTGITRAGTTVGTVDYMAPEQARDSRAADIRSDIYSLGCTWYHMLTGKPPFSEGSLTNKLSAHATQPPPNPRNLNEQVPEAVVAVLHRMMAKSPESRYQTPHELLEDLNSAHLHRGPVSNDVLAGLSHDSGENTPTNGSAAGASSSGTAASRPNSGSGSGAAVAGAAGASTMPPRRKRSEKGEGEKDDSGGSNINIEPLKVFVLVAGAGTVFWLLWWLISGFASSLDSGSTNPFAGGPSKSEQITELTGGPNPSNEAEVPTVSAAEANPRTVTAPPRTSSQEPGGNQTETVKTVPPKEGPENSAAVASSEERKVMPLWAAETSKPPAATAEAAPPERTVGRSDTGAGQFATLNEALRDLPETGAVVRLLSEGPHYLFPTTLENRGQVTIAAAADTHPVVVLVPNREGVAEGVLRLKNTSLILAGVHLLVNSRQFATDRGANLVEVTSGDLTVRQSSVTQFGEHPKLFTAFRVAGAQQRTDRSPPNSSRILLDRVMVRGGGLTALDLDQASTDMLATNCLFATGNAPVLRLTSSLTAVPPPKSRSGEPLPDRTLRFIACTAVCRESALELTPGVDAQQPPLTSLLTLNSVFASPQDAAASRLVALPGWPKESRSERGRSLFRKLKFTTTATAFAGWKRLIAGDSSQETQVQGASFWENTWGEPIRANEIQSTAWNESQISNFATLTPATLDAATLNAPGVRTADGERPGCRTSLLAVPAAEPLERAEAWAYRPRPPEHLVPAKGKTIPVDARDLGRMISAGDWPDGTTFVLSGAGFVKSSPIKVRGKSFRLKFSDEASGLVIEARPADYKSGTDAFISVTDGNVEIIGGQFKIPASSRGETPKWFLSVENGSFALHGCHLNGPMTESPRYEAAIRWTAPDVAPVEKPLPGQYERFGRIVGCYLAGEGKVLLADLRGFGLLVRDSALVGIDDLFDIDIIGKGATIAAAVDVQDSTLATNGTFFTLRAANVGEESKSPLRCYVDRTVFAPPLDAGSASPTLLTYSGLARQQRQIDWWEEDNGYAGEIKTYLRGMSVPASAGAQSFETAWIDVWGRSHVLRPLTDRGGVLMVAAYPSPVRLTPADLSLAASSKAAKWAPDGQAIGAEIGSLPDGTARTPPPRSQSKGKDKEKEAPGTTKKPGNPGF